MALENNDFGSLIEALLHPKLELDELYKSLSELEQDEVRDACGKHVLQRGDLFESLSFLSDEKRNEFVTGFLLLLPDQKRMLYACWQARILLEIANDLDAEGKKVKRGVLMGLSNLKSILNLAQQNGDTWGEGFNLVYDEIQTTLRASRWSNRLNIMQSYGKESKILGRMQLLQKGFQDRAKFVVGENGSNPADWNQFLSEFQNRMGMSFEELQWSLEEKERKEEERQILKLVQALRSITDPLPSIEKYEFLQGIQNNDQSAWDKVLAAFEEPERKSLQKFANFDKMKRFLNIGGMIEQAESQFTAEMKAAVGEWKSRIGKVEFQALDTLLTQLGSEAAVEVLQENIQLLGSIPEALKEKLSPIIEELKSYLNNELDKEEERIGAIRNLQLADSIKSLQ